MGFLLLGGLAQTLLARAFEGGGPPRQPIEHLPGGPSCFPITWP
jgi:hypothetical protein